MAIMRISRFRDSRETVLAFKHLSDFVEMQPVREPVSTLDAPARRLAAHAMGERNDPLLTLRP
jgi:hypothetical protein